MYDRETTTFHKKGIEINGRKEEKKNPLIFIYIISYYALTCNSYYALTCTKKNGS